MDSSILNSAVADANEDIRDGKLYDFRSTVLDLVTIISKNNDLIESLQRDTDAKIEALRIANDAVRAKIRALDFKPHQDITI